jgi:hypothetical protein
MLPFGPNTMIAVGSNRVIVGDNAGYELRVFLQSGNLERIVRIPGDPRPVTSQDLELELERRLQGAPPIDEIRDGVRALFEATPIPDTMPYYDQLIVDGEGYIWVKRGSHTWDIIAPEGRWIGALETPPGLKITQIGSDYLIGIWTGEYGVEGVRVYEVTRRVP